MKVRVRATYEELEWPEAEDDAEPIITHGYTDPDNPWGGFDAEVPEGLCGEPFVAWRDENATTVTLDSLWEAAEYVREFPGGVWDYSEAEYDRDPYTGTERAVTLHVEDHAAAVFELADLMARLAARR